MHLLQCVPVALPCVIVSRRREPADYQIWALVCGQASEGKERGRAHKVNADNRNTQRHLKSSKVRQKHATTKPQPFVRRYRHSRCLQTSPCCSCVHVGNRCGATSYICSGR